MNGDNEGGKAESKTLRSLLGGNAKDAHVERFFDSVWQEQCAEFRWQNRLVFLPNTETLTDSDDSTNDWNDDAVKCSPYEEMVHKGFPCLVRLLHQASGACTPPAPQVQDPLSPHNTPLLFKDQSSVTDELEFSYHNDLFAAFLDGCSIVLNHADWTCPWIAALCQDLQDSFPHAYANVYITPPASQSVRAHADDRDVIVIQVAGQKHWKIYAQVPIPLPYPPEQVGKDGLAVPPGVLQGPRLLETTLHPGDAIYMPRGYVHEATADPTDFSFHVTIALATHDWTLAGMVGDATSKILGRVLEYRKAIHRKIGIDPLDRIPAQERDRLQDQIQTAFQLLQEEITLDSISANLNHKFHRHNHRAFSARMKLLHEMRFPLEETCNGSAVGPAAAKAVSLDSHVRGATEAEKESVWRDRPKGLRVREAVADPIVQILTALKQRPMDGGIRVRDLKSLLPPNTPLNSQQVCQLTLLSLAKVCVEQGALALVPL